MPWNSGDSKLMFVVCSSVVITLCMNVVAVAGGVGLTLQRCSSRNRAQSWQRGRADVNQRSSPSFVPRSPAKTTQNNATNQYQFEEAGKDVSGQNVASAASERRDRWRPGRCHMSGKGKAKARELDRTGGKMLPRKRQWRCGKKSLTL